MLGSTAPDGRRIRLAVRAEGDQRDLVLHLVHGFVIRGRAGAVDASEYPDHVGRRLILRHTGGKCARPAGPGDNIRLRAGAGRALAGDLKHRCPRVDHREQVVAPVRVREAERIGLLAKVDPSVRIKSVGIWSGNVTKSSTWVGSRPRQLPHWRFQTARLCNVGQNPTRVLHRDQRIAVNVCVCRDSGCFIRAYRRRRGTLLRDCMRDGKRDDHERERYGSRAEAKAK